MVSDSNFVFFCETISLLNEPLLLLEPSLLRTMTTTGVRKTKILEIFVNHNAI